VCQRTLEGTFPAFPAIVQIGSSSGELASRIHLHSLGCAHQTDQPAFGQNFTAAHTGPLRHMFYTLNRFLRHLRLKSLHSAMTITILPIVAKLIVTALVLLATDDFAAFLIEFQLNALFLTLLALLLIGVVFLCTGGLEDLRLHLEELIQ